MSISSSDSLIPVLKNQTLNLSMNSEFDPSNHSSDSSFGLDLPQFTDISSHHKLKQALNQIRQISDNTVAEDKIIDSLNTETVDKQINKTLESLKKTVIHLQDSINDNRTFDDNNTDILDVVFNDSNHTIMDQSMNSQIKTPKSAKKLNKRRKRSLNLKRHSRASNTNRLYFCFTDGCGGRQYFGLSSMQKHIHSMHLKPRLDENQFQIDKFQPTIDLTHIKVNSEVKKTPKKLFNKPKIKSLSVSSRKASKPLANIWRKVYICKTNECNHKCYKLEEMQRHIRSEHFFNSEPKLKERSIFDCCSVL